MAARGLTNKLRNHILSTGGTPDPDIKAIASLESNGKGARTDNHPRLCNAVSETSGKRCRAFAVRGSDYCNNHGGTLPENKSEKKPLPGFYRDNLAPAFRKRLDNMLSVPLHRQTSLYEELSVARIAASESVKLLSVAIDEKSTASANTRAMACSLAQQAMDKVASLVEKISLIESRSREKVSLTILDLFVEQLIQQVYSVLCDYPDLAKKLEVAIKSIISLPEEGNLERDIQSSILQASTPDVASAMDSITVPSDTSQTVE